nr:arf-GAP with coiled-coil, ANK repeat and PH domain-containing protein 1 [Chrysemys picta bellii]
MTVKLDFEECLKDSPRFRWVSRWGGAVRFGPGAGSPSTHWSPTSSSPGAACALLRISPCASGVGAKPCRGGKQEQGWGECLEKFSDSLNQMIDNQVELLDSTQHSSRQHIYTLVKEDVKRFKEARKEFERGSEGLASALHHNAEVPRRKQHEAEEAALALQAARTSARARALDYVLQVGTGARVCLGSVVLETVPGGSGQHHRPGERGAVRCQAVTPPSAPQMLAVMEAQACCLEQGHRLTQQLEKYRRELAAQLHQLVLESAREKRDMEQRHAMIKQKDLSQDEAVLEGRGEAPDGVVMEGYLYKRASNAFKTWSRRWFSIQSNQLVYQKRAKDVLTVVVEDLRLCTVKPCPDHERRFCFEVVSPSKSCLLQADSDRHQQAWLTAVQNSIASAFSEGRAEPPGQVWTPPGKPPSPPPPARGGPSPPARYGPPQGHPHPLCLQPGAGRAPRPGTDPPRDTPIPSASSQGRAEPPGQCSPRLGITLCFECSGIHRSLGVHFSKVRSLTLDSWEPELVKLMCELGNGALNRIYEARVDEMTVKRPQPGCSRAPPLCPAPEPGEAGSPPEDLRSLHPGALLYWAAGHQNLPTMADALAHGADVNWVNTAEDSRTPLLQAVAANSLLACEFLLQNGANVNQADSAGQGPLHHATILGHTGLACLFLKRGANLNAVDMEGKDPLSIAIDTANADIVTLLRLAKMREAEVAQGQSGDETYLDIFRDFSLMASDNPEKLTRRDLKLTTL